MYAIFSGNFVAITLKLSIFPREVNSYMRKF